MIPQHYFAATRSKVMLTRGGPICLSGLFSLGTLGDHACLPLGRCECDQAPPIESSIWWRWGTFFFFFRFYRAFNELYHRNILRYQRKPCITNGFHKSLFFFTKWISTRSVWILSHWTLAWCPWLHPDISVIVWIKIKIGNKNIKCHNSRALEGTLVEFLFVSKKLFSLLQVMGSATGHPVDSGMWKVFLKAFFKSCI